MLMTMTKEFEIVIDGFNRQDGFVYAVEHEIEHHYYVSSRRVSLDEIRRFENEHGRLEFLDDNVRALAAVSVFDSFRRKEFDTESAADKYWSQCMLRQGALF